MLGFQGSLEGIRGSRKSRTEGVTDGLEDVTTHWSSMASARIWSWRAK